MDSTVSLADKLFSYMYPTVTQYDKIAGTALGTGIDSFTAGDYDKAVRDFRRCIAMSPYSDNALKAYGYMADAYAKLGKTSDAIKACRQAIGMFPSDDTLNLKLGNLLYGDKKYSEAVEQYKQAVKKNPNEYDNVYSLGEGYLSQGNYADAVAQFKRAIQLNPKDSGGHYGLGKAYERMGRLSEAQEQLEKAVAIDNDLSDAHYELGVVYTKQERTRKADSELDILSDQSTELYVQLQAEINKTTSPRIRTAYSTYLNLSAPAGTEVSSLDSSLETPGATKNYTVSFIFDKDMDISSVLNVFNWKISRSTGMSTGGLYNWGMAIPDTEISISSIPLNVTYNPDSLTAKITIAITQNATGDGTIELSHLVFRFKGTDEYGNAMDTTADQYNGIAKVVEGMPIDVGRLQVLRRSTSPRDQPTPQVCFITGHDSSYPARWTSSLPFDPSGRPIQLST